MPVEDDTHLNLSCSVGTIGADMVVDRARNAPEYQFRKYGTSRVEQENNAPWTISTWYPFSIWRNRTGRTRC